MPDTLLPALMKSAAEAKHTNARSSVYSIRSWPCSSLTKLYSIVFIVVHSSSPLEHAPCQDCCTAKRRADKQLRYPCRAGVTLCHKTIARSAPASDISAKDGAVTSVIS